jgi:hypothetical protein
MRQERNISVYYNTQVMRIIQSGQNTQIISMFDIKFFRSLVNKSEVFYIYVMQKVREIALLRNIPEESIERLNCPIELRERYFAEVREKLHDIISRKDLSITSFNFLKTVHEVLLKDIKILKKIIKVYINVYGNSIDKHNIRIMRSKIKSRLEVMNEIILDIDSDLLA